MRAVWFISHTRTLHNSAICSGDHSQPISSSPPSWMELPQLSVLFRGAVPSNLKSDGVLMLQLLRGVRGEGKLASLGAVALAVRVAVVVGRRGSGGWGRTRDSDENAACRRAAIVVARKRGKF